MITVGEVREINKTLRGIVKDTDFVVILFRDNELQVTTNIPLELFDEAKESIIASLSKEPIAKGTIIYDKPRTN